MSVVVGTFMWTLLQKIMNLGLYKSRECLYALSKVKGKVVPVLLTEHHAMKAYWGSGGIAPLIL
jgi:hypothetical protein